MSADREAARRLMALLENEHEIETAPVAEIGTDLRLLGMDAAGAVAQAWRLADAERSPAGLLLAHVERAEASEREIAEVEAVSIEAVHARLAGSRVAPAATPEPAEAAATGPDAARRRGDWLTPPVISGLLRCGRPARSSSPGRSLI